MTSLSAKKVVSCITRVLYRKFPTSSVTKFTAPACFSTAYTHAHKGDSVARPADRAVVAPGSPPIAEPAWASLTGASGRTGARDGRSAEEDESGVTGDVAEKAREGVMKGTEAVESVGEMARKTLDTAFDTAKGTTQAIQDTVIAGADENVIDTSEYRTIEDNFNSYKV